MTIQEVKDLNGRTPKIGDHIALAVGWTTNNAYLNIARITQIIETEKTVKLILETEKTGLYYGETHWTDRKSAIAFPSSHCKFLILD